MIVSKAPGRINIIGEHTDYNDGFVLPASIDKGCTFKLEANVNPDMVSVRADNMGETFEFNLKNFEPLQSGGWPNYVMGVVHELQKLGAEVKGFVGSFNGNVPIGSGMSSSAALECSLAIGLNALFNLNLDKWQLIKASQMAEHNYVGIKCGIMDQFTSVMGKKDQVVLLDCRSLEYEYHPLKLGNYQLLLLNTNVSHELASSEYNTRRAECQEGVKLINRSYKNVQSLRDSDMKMLKAIQPLSDGNVFQRCRHVIKENDRVIKAIRALGENDLVHLGQLLYQSHQSLSGDYQVSCRELDFLVDFTKDIDFVLGSRMMGGGFGGCTINIVIKNKVDEFVEKASLAYQSIFGIELTPYEVSIEDGAHVTLN